MLSRISTRTTAMTSLTNLQAGQARSHKLQEQLTSGKAITKPSDNPVAASEALRYRAEIAVNEQHGRNIADAEAWMSTQENALDTTLKGLQRVRDLTVQAASTGALNETARRGIATEIRGIRASLLAAANTEHLGRPVFAGAAAVTDGAFDPTTGAYLGDGLGIRRSVGPGVDVQVNIPGSQAFGGAPGTPTVFEELEQLAATIEAGDGTAVSGGLRTVDTALDRVKDGLATIGARSNQLEALRTRSETRGDSLAAALDDVEGIDLAKAMVEYNLQSTAYQAALAATAKVIQPTLLDFLR